MMLTLILMMLASKEIHIYIFSILVGFFTVLIMIPFTSLTYTTAKKEGIDEFIIFREIPVAIGRTFILALGLLLTTKIEFIFLVSGLSYILFLFL